MSLEAWASKWGVSPEAVEDLRREFGAVDLNPETIPGESEAAVQVKVRLEASEKGALLLRNNVGAGYSSDGSFVRWGLANDSAAVNKKTKSSDLIGINPILITEAHVGQVIGQFLAREVKRGGWRYSGTQPERAQLHFMELIYSLGGDAQFVNSTGSL